MDRQAEIIPLPDYTAEPGEPGLTPFAQALPPGSLPLRRGKTVTLQVNVGLACNQYCKHCHLDAGPERPEMMSRDTVDQVAAYAARGAFAVADVTGGAPELNPHLPRLLTALAPLVQTLMLRANLSALSLPRNRHLWRLLPDLGVTVVASFPSLNQGQTDAQRGRGVHAASLAALKRLNSLGYGDPAGGLKLDLVSNPAGAFLPPAQGQAEDRFRKALSAKHGIVFNNLFTFANAPLGRFKDWLVKSGNYQGYLEKLAGVFNPCALDGVMCRNLVSVNWDGHLYDCDFNLAAGLPMGGEKRHVSRMDGPPEEGSPIAVGNHCYSCTAGAGFT